MYSEKMQFNVAFVSRERTIMYKYIYSINTEAGCSEMHERSGILLFHIRIPEVHAFPDSTPLYVVITVRSNVLT